jgi:hypothetical protein
MGDGYDWPGKAEYCPGNGLRMWRDCLPFATIHGMDVQPDTQFVDDRIVTHLCDSMNDGQVSAAINSSVFDLIIDDGSHEPADQLATMGNLLPHLADGGHYIIEDAGLNIEPVYLRRVVIMATAAGCAASVDLFDQPAHHAALVHIYKDPIS